MDSSPLSVPLVDLARQHRLIERQLHAAIDQVVRSCEFVGGSQLHTFERRFADYCGARHCVGLGNGTDAITIALKALGVGPGNEVIVPAISFYATAEAVSNAGADVVFCEIDPATANIDARRIQGLVGPRTRAIIPVHLYGQPADMDTILSIAKTNNLRVVEDCAQAAGARYRDRRIGALGDIGCFSFYPTKNLGAFGDGGAIVTDDDSLAETCRMLGSHGGLRRYEHRRVGYNSRLDALQAAVLNVKLDHLDDWNDQRREIAARYVALLRSPSIELLDAIPEVEHIHHLFPVRVEARDDVMRRLNEAGVEANVHYPWALPALPPYSNEPRNAAANFAHAHSHARTVLTLPIFPLMTDAEVQHVARSLLRIVGERLP